MQVTAKADSAAAGFSIACILHCLALPLMATVLPIAGILAEAEWVHWVFAALAILASGQVIMVSDTARRASFMVPALLGIILLVAALYAGSVGFEETLPTVTGGLFLATAHLGRLIKHP